MSGAWVTPGDAERLIAAHMGIETASLHKARNQLETWIEQGSVRIVATETIRFTSGDQGKAMGVLSAPTRLIEHDVPITVKEWVDAILSGDDSSLWTIGEIVQRLSSDGLPPARIVYSGVKLSGDDLERRFQLAGWRPLQSDVSLAVPHERTARAPGWKAGRPPSNDEILAKADEMRAKSLDGRTIARDMHLEPGFENVATTDVRELIKGRWPRTGRPKNAHKSA